jgi:hypothetical protein
VQDQPREGVALRHAPSFRHQLQHRAGHPPHRHRVLVQEIAAGPRTRSCQRKS